MTNDDLMRLRLLHSQPIDNLTFAFIFSSVLRATVCSLYLDRSIALSGAFHLCSLQYLFHSSFFRRSPWGDRCLYEILGGKVLGEEMRTKVFAMKMKGTEGGGAAERKDCVST